MVRKTIGKRLIEPKRAGQLTFKKFAFEIAQVSEDIDGNIRYTPFCQNIACLIACSQQALWLNPEQLQDLRSLLEEKVTPLPSLATISSDTARMGEELSFQILEKEISPRRGE